MSSVVATDNWCIKVAGKVYGPYSGPQMKAFAKEGRLSETSSVAPAGSTVWREARTYSQLAPLFAGSTSVTSRSDDKRSFGRATNSQDHNSPPEGALANFILIFDSAPGTAGRIEQVLRGLGEGFRLAENVWVLSSTQSVLGIKNAIAPHLTSREPIFIVDASRGRSAWQNYVPELHSRLTKAWLQVHP